VPLKLNELYRVTSFTTRGNRVGAVVAGFTVQTTMTLRETIQILVLLIAWFVVTIITARLVQPGFTVFLSYIFMTIRTQAALGSF
jgi:hypothetical protein